MFFSRVFGSLKSKTILIITSFLVVLSFFFTLSLSAANFAYVVNYNDNSVTKIDLDTFTVIGTPLTDASLVGPWAIAIDGTFAYVLNYDGNSVSKIDLDTFTVVGSLSGSFSNPNSIAISDGFAYVTNDGSSSVTKIDLSTFSVIGVPLTDVSIFGPNAIAVNDGFAYVTNYFNFLITKIELSTFTVNNSLSISPNPPRDIVISNGFAYIVGDGNKVNKIDLATFTQSAGSPLTNASFSGTNAIVINNGFAYVINYFANSISKIDLNSFTVVGSPLTGLSGAPLDIAISPDFAYVTDVTNGVTKINLNSFTIEGTPLSGSFNYPLAIALFIEVPPPNPSSLEPPIGFTGVQKKNESPFQVTRANYLSWQPPSSGTSPASYALYRDASLTDLIARVPASSPLVFKDANRKKKVAYTYYLVSISEIGVQSSPVAITVNPR